MRIYLRYGSEHPINEFRTYIKSRNQNAFKTPKHRMSQAPDSPNPTYLSEPKNKHKMGEHHFRLRGHAFLVLQPNSVFTSCSVSRPYSSRRERSLPFLSCIQCAYLPHAPMACKCVAFRISELGGYFTLVGSHSIRRRNELGMN